MKTEINKFEEIAKKIIEFSNLRRWKNSPGDFAKSIMIEGAELLEHFQWDESLKNRGISIQSKDKDKIGAEVADIFYYLISFCNETEIDLLESMQNKLDLLEIKYPLKMFKEKDNHEFYLKQKKKYRNERL